MLQLVQKLKNGQMKTLEVPSPVLGHGMILVKNYYSLISPGTEGSTVKAARKSLLGKARQRPQQVKQVIDVLKSQGPVQTYRTVMKKLDAYSPLGYSCVGEVIAVGPDVTQFKVGDFAACGGLSANHAEIVAVPVNLSVKINPKSDLRQACYNTLGAIAMQGIRQADLRLGETCAVIGLGLLGQLTCCMLRASGVKVFGIDVNEDMVSMARQNSADLALLRNEPGIEGTIDQFTQGLGCDAVIITAATSSLDPINFAGNLARKKGTIVIVGDVATGFDRDPHYYRKELQVKMSCSYGPGRYDPVYEERGIDYPPAYVRWTEKRNMQTFQDLILTEKISISYLTTHTFKLQDATQAYDLIINQKEPAIGIIIEYDHDKKHSLNETRVNLKDFSAQLTSKLGIGFIGAGSYAQSHLLPDIPGEEKKNLIGIMTRTGTSSRSTAERFGFSFCTTKIKDILENKDINTVFIATRHDSHAQYVEQALSSEKHVFVEKPLCLNFDQLERIKSIYLKLTNRPALMVGYNRRFSPFVQKARKLASARPLAINYRINAGSIPKESWVQDMEIGGGRIVGEICHFIDTITFLCGSLPSSVYATALPDKNHFNDTVQINLKYENGSIATISYLANGNKKLPKERIEIFFHGVSIVIDDFKTMTTYVKEQKKKQRLFSQDKGQKNEVKTFLEHIKNGQPGPIPFHELYSTSAASFKAFKSIQTGLPVML